MEHTLYTGQNQKGQLFTITSYESLQDLKDYLIAMKAVSIPGEKARGKALAVIEEEGLDDQYALELADKDGSGARYTQKERDTNVAQLEALIHDIESNGCREIMIQLPRKKNNTLAKGRVTILWQGDTFRRIWEEGYGFNTPVVRVKNISDFNAELQITTETIPY